MPKTYEPIATTNAGPTQSTYTFTSIPSTYTDLVLIISPVGNGDAQVNLRFNSDTGTNYSYTVLGGNGTSAVADRVADATFIGTDYYFSVTTAGGVIRANIMNYANSTTFKTALMRADNAGKGTMTNVGLWRNTAAITSVTVTTTNSTFANGSTLTLYGIKAA
jgi:hypothetical protein